MSSINQAIVTEFEKQAGNLIKLGYPKAAGMTKSKFVDSLISLKENLHEVKWFEPDLEKGRVPFLIVVKGELVASEKSMSLIVRNMKKGIAKLDPHASTDFLSLPKFKIPQSPCYLLLDVERGDEYKNVTPKLAEAKIQRKKRTPLTIDEGVAFVTQFPDHLIKNHCFSLVASRLNKGKAVPAIWINSSKHPNLGWCWYENPHTWLGSASCKSRL